MIDQEFIARARLDFIRNFGDTGDVEAKTEVVGHEEMIVVENGLKRAFYSQEVELVKVLNLKGDE